MKKVLWVCNIMLPVIAQELGFPYSNREGWLTGIFNALTAKKENREIELGICFPIAAFSEHPSLQKGKPLMVQGVPCYAFAEDLAHPEVYDAGMEEDFKTIFADFQPDMIHVFGTEFPHALAAVRVFENPDKTLIGIQGLCYEIAKVYMAGLPKKVCQSVTFRDIIRKDSLKQQQEKFIQRGEREKEVLRLAGHVTGRTGFDRKGVSTVNEKARYHSMNETMRSSFYSGAWNRESCEKYSIFLGQGDYPLKGFHFLLKALPLICKEFPDTKVYVAGNSIINEKGLKAKIKLSAYGKYLLSLIRKYELKDKIIVLGKLTEQEMKEQFLRSSVFVCPSILENSPNTIGEAMLLGMPVAAAKVGGIPDMITHEEDGLLFEGGNAAELAKAVLRLFEDKKDESGCPLTQKLSQNARKRAAKVHDGAQNYCRLMEIYEDICRKE